jgi:hypothetical protein
MFKQEKKRCCYQRSHQKLLTSTIECEYAFSQKFFFYDPATIDLLFTEKEIHLFDFATKNDNAIPHLTLTPLITQPNLIFIQDMLQTIFQPYVIKQLLLRLYFLFSAI